MPTAAFMDTNFLQGGYRLLFSEDLNSEQVYDGVMVLNPFDQGGRWIKEDPPRLGRLD